MRYNNICIWVSENYETLCSNYITQLIEEIAKFDNIKI